MKFSDKLGMALNDLVHRKGRTILTMLAVAIGSLLLIILLGIGDGVIDKMKQVVESFGDINAVYVQPMDASKSENPMEVSISGDSSEVDLSEVDGDEAIENQNSEPEGYKKITEEDLDDVVDVEGVESIYVAIQGGVTSYKLEGKDYIDKSMQVVGENTKYDKDHKDSLVCGNEISDKDDDILICENLIKKLGLDDNQDIIGKKITVKVEMPTIEGMEQENLKKPLEVTGTVVGVLDRKEFMNCIVMDQKKAEPLLGYYEGINNFIEEKGYSGIKVIAKDGVNGTKLATKIQEKTGYLCISMSMISDIFDSMSGIVKGILSIGGIIVIIVSGLGLVNTIGMILQEKRKMIGVMRSVGGSQKDIKSIFLIQAVIIGVLGCIVGALLSVITILISNQFITKSSGFVTALNPINMLVALVITFIISLVSGVVPANRAAKLNVVQAIAEE